MAICLRLRARPRAVPQASVLALVAGACPASATHLTAARGGMLVQPPLTWYRDDTSKMLRRAQRRMMRMNVAAVAATRHTLRHIVDAGAAHHTLHLGMYATGSRVRSVIAWHGAHLGDVHENTAAAHLELAIAAEVRSDLASVGVDMGVSVSVSVGANIAVAAHHRATTAVDVAAARHHHRNAVPARQVLVRVAMRIETASMIVLTAARFLTVAGGEQSLSPTACMRAGMCTCTA